MHSTDLKHSSSINATKWIATVSLVSALAACGGGGDGGTATSGTTPSNPSTPTTTVPTSTAPVTSVPASTYASSDQRSTLFTLMNNYRQQMGVGQLTQDPLMDVAAQAHADYLNTNGTTGGHVEDSTKPGFYAAYPRDRATKAGVAAATWVGEMVSGTGTASACLSGMTNSVYHLQALTSNAETIGLGFNTYCVFDMGTTTGETGTPTLNAIPVGGGQQMPANAIAYSPLDNETVDKAMGGESPQPAPDIANPGHPIMVRVRADVASDVLSVTSFTLVDSLGAAVPGRILIAPNAQGASTSSAVTDSGLNPGVAFFLPLSPLGSQKTYTATFSGARNGTAISKSWSFKTVF